MSKSIPDELSNLPSPPRTRRDKPSTPYTVGSTFLANAHHPPAPFGKRPYSKLAEPDQEELRRVQQVDWCLSHPPAPGNVCRNVSRTFTIQSTIRTGDEGGAQIVLIDNGMVAKIYDPVYYPFFDREFPSRMFDVAVMADSDYSVEAAAYLELQDSPLQGDTVPEYYGSWTIEVTNEYQDEHITREVRLILVQHIAGVPMLDISPEDLLPEARENIMVKVAEADYDVRAAGVQHFDLEPRNIIIRTPTDYTDPALRVTIVDFGRSLVYRVYSGQPLPQKYCNPLFTWSWASKWSSYGWLPRPNEDTVNKAWRLWGDGKGGKYAAVKRNPRHLLGRPVDSDDESVDSEDECSENEDCGGEQTG
ncbi:hypothetical protein N0V94_009035 [Neodidymelliopsis sp. IMI 364377]|nr:hypothetical protein N0V94_009035 [Neodidymelliopsis sp. IMI 364377]